MADEDSGEAPKRKKKGGLLVGLVLAIAAGSTAFAFTSGMIDLGAHKAAKATGLADGLDFVPIEPMTVAIGNPADHRYLRFRAELEVDADHKGEIEKLMPRVVDVLNTYLHSLELADI